MSGVRTFRFELGGTPHEFVLGADLLEDLPQFIGADRTESGCVLVTDEGLIETDWPEQVSGALADAGHRVETAVVPAGEAAKSLGEAERLWSLFGSFGLERSGLVVALGGGAVGDLAGFCASTWMRGVEVVQVPTTLLSMADSSVGGKTAINFGEAKNRIGTFHVPSSVIADVRCLQTLPGAELRSGMAEVVKCALLSERDALAGFRADAGRLMAREPEPLIEAVSLAVRVKEEHVRHDPHDRAGVRALLNLGHTTAHALESARCGVPLRHGEAVSIGLVVAARISEGRGTTAPALRHEIERTLSTLGLPTSVPAEFATAELLEAARGDKKREAGEHRMVLPLADGGAELVTVGEDELAAALDASRST